MSEYWDQVGGDYDEEWRTSARQALSRAELAFVTDHLARAPGGRVLDVGVGSGRILGALLEAAGVERAVGIDASTEMADVCRRRFAGHPNLERVEVRDVAVDGPPDGEPFDFISAVRVLKYQRSWPTVVAALLGRLAPGGVLVFTMPNRRSLNAISRSYAVPWFATSRVELEALCRELGVELLAMTAFTKLPFFLYGRARGPRAGRLPVLLDRALDRVVGSQRLGRELFVAVRAAG